jgi:hypothetical protein
VASWSLCLCETDATADLGDLVVCEKTDVDLDSGFLELDNSIQNPDVNLQMHFQAIPLLRAFEVFTSVSDCVSRCFFSFYYC